MNIRECKQCHKMVDFDEPWCDHETMEESAWLDIAERQKAVHQHNAEVTAALFDKEVDKVVQRAAEELGFQAGKDIAKLNRETFDK